MASPAPPPVPEAELETRGWTRSDDRSETVFEGIGVSVEGRTLVYEDRALRNAVVDAGGPDRIWRFLFVSRLEIVPPPAFGIHGVIRPYVYSESKRAFLDRLRDRDIESIAVGTSERMELAGDRGARSTPYRGTVTVGTDGGPDVEVDLVGRLALWYDEAFYVAGCVSPSGSIDGWIELDIDDEGLFELIRTVA